MSRALPLVVLLAACSRAPSPEPGPPLTATPLRERAAAPGPRFQRLDPKVTGLDFTNTLRPQNTVPYVYVGGGVAIGDYDGDGLPDVFLCSLDGPNKLFKQVAPMRFVDVTAQAGGPNGGLDGGDAWSTAAAFADVDGDGRLDLYVCNFESPNQLWLNNGDGTFRECAGQFGLAITAACTGCAFADYDADGDLDLFVVTDRMFGPALAQEIVDEVQLPTSVKKTRAQLFPPYPRFERRDGKPVVPAGYEDFFAAVEDQVVAAGQRDYLMRNDGHGRFRDATEEAGIRGHGTGLSACWWDCDGDGRPDLYVANDLEAPDQLWHNRGDGTFEEITTNALPHVAYFGMGCDFGDIDGDGRFDFCVADMSSTTHYMGKMLMGSMGDKRWFLTHSDPQQYMRNAVFLNTGTGRFLEAGYLLGLASTDWTWTVRFVDLDEDGRLDFYATNGIPRFEDNPDTVAEFRRLLRAGHKAEALALARNLEPVPERNIARRNAGDLRFVDCGKEWGLDELGVSQAAAFADLDRDGDLDLIVNNLNAPASLCENRTSDTHRIEVQLRGMHSNTFGLGSRIEVAAGGTTQVRMLSPTRGYMSAGEPVEHFGLGTATRIDRLTVRWPDGHEQQFADLPADQLYTVREENAPPPGAPPTAKTIGTANGAAPAKAALFAPSDAIPVRHRERDFDDYALQPLLPARLSRLGPGMAWGDVDGDGRDDVYIGGAAGQAGTLLLAQAGGRFTPVDGPWQQDAECEDLGALLFDADGDGDLDLFVVSGGVEAGKRTELLQSRLYLNDGHGRFARAPAGALPDLRFSGSCVCAADFDGDGDLDLFVGGRVVPGRFPEAPPSVLLRNDGGRFVDVTAAFAPGLCNVGMVTSACWADVDGDGLPDLVIAAQWQPVRVFLNDHGTALRDATAQFGLDAIRGQWNGVAAADLDGDGDLDLVVTNLGLNSKYKASADHPLHLFAADFDGNGTFDVVEAKHQGDQLLPVRGRSCSSQAMPMLAEKFKTYDAFAKATLQEIYGQQELAQSLDLQCNELQSLVLENRGGKFVPHPLPRRAQIAPGFGIGIADLDGDGVLDLVLAQNSWSPEPETGRMDGGLGLVLRGLGGCAFEPVPALESGVVLPVDQKALAIVDLGDDGTPGFVVTVNDGPVRAFAAGGDAAPALAVRLRGPKGNPTAIGARVTLVSPDGKRQARELQAGAGYLTQGPACAYFRRVAAGSKIEVRWPDGATTTHALAATTGRLLLGR